MVDRIVKCEGAAGRFGRPTLDRDVKEEAAAPPVGSPGGDMVEELLAKEAARKRELELKKQAEEVALQKVADLKAKNVTQLKALLSGKGRDTAGTKDELVAALIRADEEEEAAAKRRAELKAIEVSDLRKLLQSKALEVSSKKDEMVDAYLAYEAKVYQEVVAYSARFAAALDERRAALEGMTQTELKDICAGKDLSASGTKEALLGRLLEALKTDGEVDQILSVQARATRREELQATGKDALLKRCTTLGINPLVKEVMVERVLSHEEEVEPAAKKARTASWAPCAGA